MMINIKERQDRGFMIKEGVVLVFLGISTWTDLRKRQVSLIITGLFAAAGLGWMLYQGALSAEILLSVGPGMFFLGLSVLTGGTLGMGDGWIITALGIFLKPEELYEMLLAAVLISAAWSGILMGIFKKKRNTEIPFVPFLLAGYAGGLFLWK